MCESEIYFIGKNIVVEEFSENLWAYKVHIGQQRIILQTRTSCLRNPIMLWKEIGTNHLIISDRTSDITYWPELL